MTKTTLSKNFLTVDGKRAGIQIDAGPWVPGVDPDQIKIRCRRGVFPRHFRAAMDFSISNASDMRTDYFESDAIKLLPGDELYDRAKALAG